MMSYWLRTVQIAKPRWMTDTLVDTAVIGASLIISLGCGWPHPAATDQTWPDVVCRRFQQRHSSALLYQMTVLSELRCHHLLFRLSDITPPRMIGPVTAHLPLIRAQVDLYIISSPVCVDVYYLFEIAYSRDMTQGEMKSVTRYIINSTYFLLVLLIVTVSKICNASRYNNGQRESTAACLASATRH